MSELVADKTSENVMTIGYNLGERNDSSLTQMLQQSPMNGL